MDPQAAVDAVLTPTEPTQTPPPIMQAETVPEPIVEPVPAPKMDETVPEEILAATQSAPVTPPPTPEIAPAVAPSMGKMAEDMPLAFAGDTPTLPPLSTPTDPNIPPLPSTPTVPIESASPVSAPKLPEPTYVPPAGAEPVVVKTKKKSKLKTIVVALFLMVATGIGLIYAYPYITLKIPGIAYVLEGECDPGETEWAGSCGKIDGCEAHKEKACRSNGTWGTSFCTKNDKKCQGASVCTSGDSRNCTITVNGVPCDGKEVCSSKQWGGCTAVSSTCGNTPDVPESRPACKVCTATTSCTRTQLGQSGVNDYTVDGVSCTSAKNNCSTNFDCISVFNKNNPQCGPDKPCTNGGVCSADFQCVDPGGPLSCGFTDNASCLAADTDGAGAAITAEAVHEPGGSASCDKTGHWCAQTRQECKITENGVSKWCLMRLETNCSGTVDARCVSKPSPTPTPNPSPIPSPIPSPTPSPVPSPIPSPTPKPTLACTGLSKDKADSDITKGTKVNFTCIGAATPANAVNLTYQFRIRKDGAAWTTLSATANKASYTVNDYGDYDVQCHACGQIDNASVCHPVWTGATQ